MEDKVLESVVENLGYDMVKDILVKPLDKVMVTKEVITPEPTGVIGADGVPEYETKTETKEVESEFAKGIVLALPVNYSENAMNTIKIGDTVVYPSKFAKDFDLYKTSQLVKPYDVVAIVK